MNADTIARTIAAVFRVRAEIAAARRGVADAPYFRHDDLLALWDAAEAGLRSPPREPDRAMTAAGVNALRVTGGDIVDDVTATWRAMWDMWNAAPKINPAPRGEWITFDALVAHGLAACRAEGREHNIINGLPWWFDFHGIAVTHENDDCYILNTQAGAVRVNRDKPKINEGGQAPCESPDRCTGAQVNADEAAHARTDGDESVTQTVPPSPDAMSHTWKSGYAQAKEEDVLSRRFCPHCNPCDGAGNEECRKPVPPSPDADLVARATAYLTGGGLFNPELANHDAVRDLIIDCRDALKRLTRERDEALAECERLRALVEAADHLYAAADHIGGTPGCLKCEAADEYRHARAAWKGEGQ